MTRKRSASAIEKERAWRGRRDAHIKRERAKVPPMPDPKTHLREYLAWVQKLPMGLNPEEKQLLSELKALPRMLKRGRGSGDESRWNMIRCLLRYQKLAKPVRGVADYDLMKCKLGKYPSPIGNAGKYSKGSKQLQDFIKILKACGHADISPSQLFESIREWRRRKKEMSPPAS